MHNNQVSDAAKFTTVNCNHPGAGSKAVQPANFDKLKKLTAALYETMRFSLSDLYPSDKPLRTLTFPLQRTAPQD